MTHQVFKKILGLLFFSCAIIWPFKAEGQRFITDMLDTSTASGKENYFISNKFDQLKFGGYMQPQFQFIESRGAETYNGGSFSENSQSRFMLRRGRIRLDYAHFDEQKRPQAYFVFQFDGTERGVAIRDFWGRIFINKGNFLSITTGLFGRPVGNEVNHSSGSREAPERGRMSQILMKSERDLGIMLSAQTRAKTSAFYKNLKFDIALLNGQGLSGPKDFDSHKDLAARLSLTPVRLGKSGWAPELSGSLSAYYGAIESRSAWLATTDEITKSVQLDSNDNHIGFLAPRQYFGADAQIKFQTSMGTTELRAEYLTGQQTATAETSETPGTYPMVGNTLEPLYTRQFDGAYFYFLQQLGKESPVLLVLKYDWYDPNKGVSGMEVQLQKGFTKADVAYKTLVTGFLWHMSSHVKLFAFADWVKNESTQINGFENDVLDNVLTFRIQYRF